MKKSDKLKKLTQLRSDLAALEDQINSLEKEVDPVLQDGFYIYCYDSRDESKAIVFHVHYGRLWCMNDTYEVYYPVTKTKVLCELELHYDKPKLNKVSALEAISYLD
jgi:hypothetical protein